VIRTTIEIITSLIGSSAGEPTLVNQKRKELNINTTPAIRTNTPVVKDPKMNVDKTTEIIPKQIYLNSKNLVIKLLMGFLLLSTGGISPPVLCKCLLHYSQIRWPPTGYLFFIREKVFDRSLGIKKR
jgi:hypothetical protein